MYRVRHEYIFLFSKRLDLNFFMIIHTLVFKIRILKNILVQIFQPEIFNVQQSFKPCSLQYSDITGVSKHVCLVLHTNTIV